MRRAQGAALGLADAGVPLGADCAQWAERTLGDILGKCLPGRSGCGYSWDATWKLLPGGDGADCTPEPTPDPADAGWGRGTVHRSPTGRPACRCLRLPGTRPPGPPLGPRAFGVLRTGSDLGTRRPAWDSGSWEV